MAAAGPVPAGDTAAAPVAPLGAAPAGADTVAADTAVADTLAADTAVADTVAADTVAADTAVADTVAAEPVPARDTTDQSMAPLESDEDLPKPARSKAASDPRSERLLSFFDARVAGVYDSNIDHDPEPRRSYGTVTRLGAGVQSARARPALMARYDFELHRFTNTEEWNRSRHDLLVELGPSLPTSPPIRLRFAAWMRIGSRTEDRQLANEIIVKPQIEVRTTPTHVLMLYASRNTRRVATAGVTRRDTVQWAGLGYFFWWHGGGLRVDGRYEGNGSERERNRYTGWTGASWMRVPVGQSYSVTAELAYNRRRYPRRFVDEALTVARADQRWSYAVALTSRLNGGRWDVGVEYELDDNRSNDPDRGYQAHRVEFKVRRRW
jgi:hypothetical protein